MIQYDISCSDMRYRTVASIRYSSGSVVWSDYDASEWHSAIPESVAEISGTGVCAYVKAHGL